MQTWPHEHISRDRRPTDPNLTPSLFLQRAIDQFKSLGLGATSPLPPSLCRHTHRHVHTHASGLLSQQLLLRVVYFLGHSIIPGNLPCFKPVTIVAVIKQCVVVPELLPVSCSRKPRFPLCRTAAFMVMLLAHTFLHCENH